MAVEKSNNLLIALRFIFGWIIISVYLLITLVAKHIPLAMLPMTLLTPPVTLIFLPPLISAGYFMFSSRMNWRVDFTMLLITILCLIGIANIQI